MNSAGVDDIMRGAQNFLKLSEINGFLLIKTVDTLFGMQNLCATYVNISTSCISKEFKDVIPNQALTLCV